ncbi:MULTISPECIES: ribosome recycling factor [Dehalococcoides]|jgi:ribosome recycling factor|uniref:ribosome recycling factor n=1 Tax=Dehalococcoides TaxID=61434 RepID=UPI0003C8608D|nr:MULTISPECIES: ribosome recycling factor [Dehalococcoides]AHB13082.1 ribosome recycling factor [Dehalococcoides mccartyi GY50]AII57525.1 ribosome recycling factor [Dehalococcoides mccartyi CG1]APH12016.1 ribosome recycling factor [Dehalococcoides mccartyi]QYY58372.1 ribosome recycling factor [Dehalococcoides mccartyi]BAQ34269.1 ribosome-recycling factor [Dehalococcoides sp. UCH007]
MINEILQKSEKKMAASLDVLSQELSGIRTGRSSPALVEHIRVEYAGVPTPINHLAGISAPDPRYITIQPWDKSCLSAIEKAIMKSDLGLMPNNDGNIIRLNIPPLSEERRQEMIKMVNKRLEEDKIAMRNVRRDAMDEMKKLEKAKEISQDDLKRGSDQLQKITDSFIAKADKLGADKETELKQV